MKSVCYSPLPFTAQSSEEVDIGRLVPLDVLREQALAPGADQAERLQEGQEPYVTRPGDADPPQAVFRAQSGLP